MATLSELRQQYPQYSSINDGDLAYRLWNKSYKGKIPMGEFADKIDLSDDGFTQMIASAQDSGYTPTAQTYAAGFVPPGSVARAAFQGATLGAGDEIIGGLAAAGEKIMGSDRLIGSLYGQYAQNERAQIDQFGKISPTAAAASEIAGAVASPANMLRGPAMLEKLGAGTRAAVTAGASGSVYGLMSGKPGERLGNAVEVGIPSAVFGGALQQGLRLTGIYAKKIGDSFTKSNQRPTLDNLRDTKNAAYQAVDASGLTFQPKDMLGLYAKSRRSAIDANYVPDVDRQTYASLRMIEAQRGKNLTIGQLDKLRQGLWKRLEASGGSEIAIRDMIDHVDDIIQGAPATNDLMQAARIANSRYKKSELLEEAFTKANNQVSSTGSGGNTLNKYRQAVTQILSNPNKSKWFNQQEREQMQQFITGGFGENLMRRIGKLSPSGNGLMLALNIGAIAADPSMMAITAVGAGSKAVSDSLSTGRAKGLLDTVARGAPNTTIPYLPGTAPLSAVIGSDVQESVPQNINQYMPGLGPRR